MTEQFKSMPDRTADTPDWKESRFIEDYLTPVFRLTCGSMLQVNLETGAYEQHVFYDSDEFPSFARGGDYGEYFESMTAKKVNPEDIPCIRSMISLESLRGKYRSGDREHEITFQFRLKNAACTNWLEAKAAMIQKDEIPIVIIVFRDITRQRQNGKIKRKYEALEKLWREDERYRIIFQQTKTIIFECDPNDSSCFISPSVTEVLCGNFDGRCIFQIFQEDDIVHHEDLPELDHFMCSIQREGVVTCVLRLRGKDGFYRFYKLSASRITDTTPAGYKIIGSLSDVDKETRQNRELFYRAEYDIITGIYNKTTFFKQTRILLEAHPDKTYHIIRFDIDKFKMVNDLYGMAEGDKVLRFIGQQIKRRAKDGEETYGRMSDDIFCLCLARGDDGAIDFLKDLEDAFSCYPITFHFIPSAGIYRVNHYHGEPIHILCDQANLAQKTVKGNFVRHYAFYRDEMSRELYRELDILGDVNRAMEEEQFAIYLQPKYDMSTGKIFGSEALVRWLHPGKGLIPPNEFIPLFEKNGFIINLDEYIWELACRTLRAWIDKGYRPFPISVNISRVHLYNPSLCSSFLKLLEKYNLEPRLLELELTESAYAENPQNLYRVMAELQKRGFTFLMDDFGSGYSSLNMLKDIPVDILKIDLNFLKNSQNDTSGRIILEATILMAQRLCLPVIAEGVETKEQAEFLQEAGCSKAQGFLYARPMPVEEFEKKFYLSST